RSPYPTRAVLVAHSKLAKVRPLLDGVDAALFVGDMDLLRSTVGFNLHRGVVASAQRLPLPHPMTLLAGAARRAAVLEDLTDAAMARADVRVRIPISPAVDSLNVGTAAAIAFRY